MILQVYLVALFRLHNHTLMQELLDKFNSGNVKSIQRINDVKTRVDFGEVIGTYISPETGNGVSTTRGIIVNSKSGVHIIPSAPN